MALLASASVSSAASCADDPNECTLKKLCEASTTLDGSNTIWATTSETAKHVALAQSLGMECGVTPIVDLCETDPSECKVSEICEKATTESAGQKTWDDSAAGHVALAKEYGLSCGVGEANAATVKTGCSVSNVAACDAAKLCLKATDNYQRKISWAQFGREYVNEAKKRGLTCGVGEITSSKKGCVVNPANCEDERLCRLGTFGPSNNKRWSEEGKDYAIEAKKRGLTCGVSGSDTSTFSGRCTAQGAAGCTNEELCYYAKSSLQHYAKEAKKRGINCGVVTKATNFKKAFTSQSKLKRQQLQYALKKLGYYSYGIDGLWGKGTSSAFVKFVSGNGLKGKRESQVFSSLLAKVDVPSSFAAPKKKVTASNNSGGWRSFSANPQYSFNQAKAICEPQAEMAGEQASSSYSSPNYGSSANCTGYGYSMNCNVRENSGGFWGGVADGIGKGFARRDAARAVLKSCMAQYGWTK